MFFLQIFFGLRKLFWFVGVGKEKLYIFAKFYPKGLTSWLGGVTKQTTIII